MLNAKLRYTLSVTISRPSLLPELVVVKVPLSIFQQSSGNTFILYPCHPSVFLPSNSNCQPLVFSLAVKVLTGAFLSSSAYNANGSLLLDFAVLIMTRAIIPRKILSEMVFIFVFFWVYENIYD